MKIKEGEVYYLKLVNNTEFEYYHCREATWVVCKVGDELELVNTYWGLEPRGNSYGGQRTLEGALKLGTLEFYFNLNHTDPIKKYETVYFADEDLFYISEQHGCTPHYFLKKGAVRDRDKMLNEIEERVEDAKCRIRSAYLDLDRFAEKRGRVESGDLEVSI